MSYKEEQNRYFECAIEDLRKAGIQSKSKSYGIFLEINDSKIQCGSESAGGISISVDFGEPPVQWFVADTLDEMINFLISTNERFVSGQFQSWSDAINSSGINSVKRFM